MARHYDAGIDVVVVNYKTTDDLIGFIDSFVDVQFEVPSSLFVVNVSPTPEDDEATETALERVGVDVGFASSPENIGYARACNQAANALALYSEPRATIAFFNADTRLRPGVLDSCHWLLGENPTWGVIGPKQVDENNRITHAGMFGTNEAVAPRGWHQDDKGQFDELRSDAITVSGAAYFVNRACWDQLTMCADYRRSAPDAQGAFLPTQHYYEETFCSYHARAHGWKVAYNGNVSMIHKWHQASPVGGFAEKEMPRSREYFRRACQQHGIAHD